MEPGAAASSRFEAGDERRAGEDLLVHGRFLRGLARALVADGERADDLVQETFATALASPPRHAGAPRAWLARILRRVAIRRGVREGERGAREELAAGAAERDARGAGEIAAEIELSRRVLECVERLREPYQSTLFLRYWRGLEPSAIAAETGTPVKTVKTRLARGLELVRVELDRAHGGRRSAWVALLVPLARGAPPAELPAPRPVAPALTPSVAPGLVLGAGLVAAAGLVTLAVYGTRASAPPERAPDPIPESAVAVPTSTASALEDPVAAHAARRTPAGVTPAPVAEGVRLRGRVLDPLGAPLAGADVSAAVLRLERRARPGRDPRDSRGSSRGDARDDAAEAARTTSDADGAFELALAEPGLVRIEVGRDGLAPLGHRLLVFAGQEVDLGELELAPGAVLAGRVVDEQGSGVEGAELVVERTDHGLVLGTDDARPARAAVSGPDGSFRVARLAAGPWRVRVLSETHAPGEAEGTCEAGETAEVEIVLATGASVRGTVVGLDPAELERAHVVARPIDALPGRPEVAREARLDARGAFELAGLAPGAELELVAVLEDAGGAAGAGGEARPRHGEPVRARAGDPVELALEVGARGGGGPRESRRSRADAGAVTEGLGAVGTGAVEVLVRGPEGALATPVGGALVACRSAAGRTAPSWRSAVDVRAAGADGRVRFDGLAPGPYELAVVAGVFGPLDVLGAGTDAWRAVEVVEGASAMLELERTPAAALRGTVRVAGERLEGARLLLARRGRRGPEPALATRSDARGAFAFAEVPPGEYELVLEHPTRPRQRRETLVIGAEDLELALELGDARLAATVTDEAGRLLAGAEVRVLDGQDASPRPARSIAATTDERGRFELGGLQPGEPLRLEVACAGHATRITAPVLPGDALVLALGPAASLALDFASPESERGARLVAHGPRGERRSFVVRAGRLSEIDDLGPGTWRLELETWEDRGPPTPLGTRVVELAAGRRTIVRW